MRRIVIALGFLAVASAAGAETLRVENFFPARSDALVMLREIQVDTLGGDVGPAMTLQVEDRLRAVDQGQGPWFRIIPASLRSETSDAVLRGMADMDFRRSEVFEERERCVRDANNKCTDEREKYQVSCQVRDFALNTNLRLIGRKGELLWSDDGREPLSDKRCSDQSGTPRHPRDIERQLISQVVRRMEQDWVPRREALDVRVDESRKGLTKEDADSFKQAVRMVRDGRPNEACDAWGLLGQRYPVHVPTQFNLGLCAEFNGRSAEAKAKYGEVLTINPRYNAASTGIGRLGLREQALRQLEMRSAG
jgi:tetratricopeptide (TPR) repeat protein